MEILYFLLMWLHSSRYFLLETLREKRAATEMELASTGRNRGHMCVLAVSLFCIWRMSGLKCLYFTNVDFLEKCKHSIEGHWHVGVRHFQMFLTAAWPTAVWIHVCLCIRVRAHEWFCEEARGLCITLCDLHLYTLINHLRHVAQCSIHEALSCCHGFSHSSDWECN